MEHKYLKTSMEMRKVILMKSNLLSSEPTKAENILFRISKIIDKLAEQEHFKKVDKSSLMERLSALAGKYSEITSLTDDELAQRIEKIMVIEMVAGMLQDLTPGEMKSFDEAVQRKGFFQ